MKLKNCILECGEHSFGEEGFYVLVELGDELQGRLLTILPLNQANQFPYFQAMMEE